MTFLATLQNSHLFQEEQTTLAAPEKKTNVHEATAIHMKTWSDRCRDNDLHLALFLAVLQISQISLGGKMK